MYVGTVAELQAAREVSVGPFPITLHPPLPTVAMPTVTVSQVYVANLHITIYLHLTKKPLISCGCRN